MENEVIGPPPLIEWGVAMQPIPGETESGDQHLVKPLPNGVLVAVVDGLGHGGKAAVAAKIAVATLGNFSHEALVSLFERCHEALKKTRGVAMSLASFNAQDNSMAWLGVGNVEGILLRKDVNVSLVREAIPLPGGVVGYKLPPLPTSVISVSTGDTLIFATDGIHYPFTENVSLNSPPQQIADRILVQHGKGIDDALVLVARYLGCTT
jgi:phosphoserine phosphatase RsbX